jgi:hypothetical protein
MCTGASPHCYCLKWIGATVDLENKSHQVIPSCLHLACERLCSTRFEPYIVFQIPAKGTCPVITCQKY